MKTTIDLPEDLVRELKLRAVRDRRKLKDLAAEILRNGLDVPSTIHRYPQPRIVKHRVSGLPVIQCAKPPGPTPSPDDIADILLEQEVQWARDAGRNTGAQ